MNYNLLLADSEAYINDLEKHRHSSEAAPYQKELAEQIVAQIIRHANHSDSLDEMAPVILSETMDLFQLHGGAVFLFNGGRHKVRLACHYNYPDEFRDIEDYLKKDSDFYHRLVEERNILIARNQRPFTASEYSGHPFILSITLPMVHRQKPVGLLQFLSGRVNNFSENEILTFRLLADECAIMLDRVARLEQAVANEKNCVELFESVSDMVLTMDRTGNIINANPAATRRLGMEHEKVTRKRLADLFPPGEGHRARQVIEDYLFRGENNKQLSMCQSGGQLLSVEAKMAVLPGDSQELVLALCRDQVKQALTDEITNHKEIYRQIFEQATDGIVLYDDRGDIVAFNQTVLDITGYDSSEVRGRCLLDFVVPEHRQIVMDKIAARMTDAGVQRIEVGIIHKDGSRLEMEISTSPVRGLDGKRLMQGIARDITERKKTEDKLKYMSLHDGLTGLYNRNYFEEELNRLESGAADPVGLIICDLDGLKLTNDYLGHQVGDDLLKQAAGIIKDCFRDCDISARIGGDEFCILLPGTDWNGVRASLRRLEKAVEIHNRRRPPVPVSLSMGCAVRYARFKTVREALKEADERMYKDKTSNYVRFTNLFTEFIEKPPGER